MGTGDSRRSAVDIAINVAVLIAAVTVVVVHLSPYLTGATAPVKRPYTIGDVIEQTGEMQFHRGSTFLLFTRSGCPYCTESMDLYRKIQSEGGRVLAVTQEAVDANRAYLATHGVFPEKVVPLAGVRVRPVPTPTLLLVDHGGVIRGAWWGKQDLAGQDDILRRLR